MNVERPRSSYARNKSVMHNALDETNYDYNSGRRHSKNAIDNISYEREHSHYTIERPSTSRGHKEINSYDENEMIGGEHYSTTNSLYSQHQTSMIDKDSNINLEHNRRQSLKSRNSQRPSVNYTNEYLLQNDQSRVTSPQHESEYPTSRPGTSSFRKYSVLPSIGNRQPSIGLQREETSLTAESLVNSNQRSNSTTMSDRMSSLKLERQASNESESSGNRNTNNNTPFSEDEMINSSSFINTIERQISSLSDEPGENEERILLAIKLPSGDRVQRYFRPNDSLSVVMEFSQKYSKETLQGCGFVCGHPRSVFNKLNKTIEQCGIKSRTVLYVESISD